VFVLLLASSHGLLGQGSSGVAGGFPTVKFLEGTAVPTKVETRVGDKSVILHWNNNPESDLVGYNVYRAAGLIDTFTLLNAVPLVLPHFTDFNVKNGQTYYYFIRAVNTSGKESLSSPTVSATPRAMTDDEFLELVQHTAFDFFWYEANPANGLIKDRSRPNSVCSIASVGFGLTAICIAIDHGWISRDEGRSRVLTTLKTFWEKPQGKGAQGIIGYKGFFYHFLDMNTAARAWNSELSSIDTGLLLAGILYAKQYFSTGDSLDVMIQALADSIYYRVDWDWMRNFEPTLIMGWFPETGFLNARWIGYNEAMILYILALGSPTHAIPLEAWAGWTSGYLWRTYYGYSFVNFPPLFGHQYSHCWIDFRNIVDDYMKSTRITYFENSRRATLAQRGYCIANPGGFPGYGANVWGLTACDGPNGYKAHGSPPPMNDDGTIAPTAAGGSMPFTPEYSLSALRYMYETYRTNIWMHYGFRDAFNLKANWWGPDVIGIDQGPIVIMVENHRTQRVWNLFMQNADIQRGLQRAGFTKVTGVVEENSEIPDAYALEQNYPNPFNASTTIRYAIPKSGHVAIQVFDVLGRKVATLVNEVKNTARYSVVFDGGKLASGLYHYRLDADGVMLTKKMLLVK